MIRKFRLKQSTEKCRCGGKLRVVYSLFVKDEKPHREKIGWQCYSCDNNRLISIEEIDLTNKNMSLF